MPPDQSTDESKSTPPSSGWRLLFWGALLITLFGLAVYDIYPLLLQSHRMRQARELVDRVITLGELKTTLKANGVEVQNIKNMNAILIRYAPRRSFIHKGIVAINEQIESSGWKIPLMPRSQIVFINDSLDDSTTVPASSL